MTRFDSGRPPRKQSGFLYSLAVLAVAAIAIYWAFVALFPVELRQVGQWLKSLLPA